MRKGQELPYDKPFAFCQKCKHMWQPRNRILPKQCPRCGSTKYLEKEYSKNVCWNPDCKNTMLIPDDTHVWKCPKCGNWNPNMHNFKAKED